VSEHLQNWKITFFQKNAEPESLITVTWQHEVHRTLALDVLLPNKGSEKLVASSHISSLMSLDQVSFTYLVR